MTLQFLIPWEQILHVLPPFNLFWKKNKGLLNEMFAVLVYGSYSNLENLE